jgi:hypothetical protein
MLTELDLRRRDWPLLCVLPRRREAYHDALLAGTAHDASEDVTNIHGAVRVKERGLEAGLTFDRYRRGALQEWIVPRETTVEAFARGDVTALLEPHGTWSADVRRVEGGVVALLSHDADGLRITKQAELPDNGERLTVRYEVQNDAAEARDAMALSEWNVSAPQAPHGDDRIAALEAAGVRVALHEDTGVIEEVSSFVVRGSASYVVQVELDPAGEVWHFPVLTVSSSEGGLERVAQGASISLAQRFALPPGGSLSFGVTWRVVDGTPERAPAP